MQDRKWVAYILACVMMTYPYTVSAQEAFFDEMLRLSDEVKKEEKQPPVARTQEISPVMVPELELPSKQDVEILMEEPPQQQEEVAKPNVPETKADSTPEGHPPVSDESLFEQMLEQSQPVTPDEGTVTEPAPTTPAAPEIELPSVQAPEQPVMDIPEMPQTPSEKAAGLPAELPPFPMDEMGDRQNTSPPVALWVGSIMFTDEEYRSLRQAISMYERRTGQKAAMSESAGQGTTVVAREGTGVAGITPSFYLGSLAYFSPEQWAVWLNNKKYTKEKSTGDINIISVSPEDVLIVWQVDSLDVIAPNWRSNVAITSTGSYISQDRLVQVNNSGTEITFTLRPNQSFISSRMEVIEGRENKAVSTLLP